MTTTSGRNVTLRMGKVGGRKRASFPTWGNPKTRGETAWGNLGKPTPRKGAKPQRSDGESAWGNQGRDTPDAHLPAHRGGNTPRCKGNRNFPHGLSGRANTESDG